MKDVGMKHSIHYSEVKCTPYDEGCGGNRLFIW